MSNSASRMVVTCWGAIRLHWVVWRRKKSQEVESDGLGFEGTERAGL